MNILKTTHRKARAVTVIAALAAAGIAIPVSHAAAAHTVARTGAHTVAYTASTRAAKPSIVLVHGAWGDSANWDDVVSQLAGGRIHRLRAAEPAARADLRRGRHP